MGLVVACESTGGASSSGETSQTGSMLAAGSDRVPLQTGAFRPGQMGIEVCSLWGIGEMALAGDPVRTDPAAVLSLRRAGIRVFECSIDEAETLAKEAEASSGLYGGGNNWIAPGVRYVEVVREPPRDGSRAIGLDGSVLRAPAGSMRLLARAWAEPIAAGAEQKGGEARVVNAMRVHVVPQASEVRTAARPETSAEIRSEMEAGLVLSRLGFEALILPGRALVMTFDGPDPALLAPTNDTAASRPPEPGQVSRVRPDAEGPGAAPESSKPSVVYAGSGPQAPSAGPLFRTPSLGEVLLTSPAPGSSFAERPTIRRRVLIFVARGPSRFELMP